MTQTGQCTNPECPSKKNLKRLNIGCGEKVFVGWINLDKSFGFFQCAEGDNTCIGYGDITNLDYSSGSVDEIYACHVLDHLSRDKELDRALSECYRVLKVEGILRVAVSDFEAISKLYHDGMDLESLWGNIVGGHKDMFDRHGCIFDFNVLRRYLEKHGFVDVKRYDWREFLPMNYEDNSCAAIPKYDLNGYPTSLNVVCKKPIF